VNISYTEDVEELETSLEARENVTKCVRKFIIHTYMTTECQEGVTVTVMLNYVLVVNDWKGQK